MIYHLDLEDMEPNHWIAWVFELPGCYSSATTPEHAVHQAPARIAAHLDWRVQRGCPSAKADSRIEVQVRETFHGYACSSNPHYIVNAFFEADRRPIQPNEVSEFWALLSATRRDLLDLLARLPAGQISRRGADPQFDTIAGILRHIATAEWWYLDRLGLSPGRETVAEDPLRRLEQVRANTLARLPHLVGDKRILVASDERWSARKVLRRALWHEQDHTQHIARLTASEAGQV